MRTDGNEIFLVALATIIVAWLGFEAGRLYERAMATFREWWSDRRERRAWLARRAKPAEKTERSETKHAAG